MCRWRYQSGVDAASIPHAPRMTIGAFKLHYNIDVYKVRVNLMRMNTFCV